MKHDETLAQHKKLKITLTAGVFILIGSNNCVSCLVFISVGLNRF